MTTYALMEYIPYEGDHEVLTGSIADIKKWLRDEKGTTYLDDLSIISLDAPDIYSVYGEMKDGNME